jgi:GT2 family glycosyltransferase
MQKIGVGITTYNRPKYLQQTIVGVANHILPYVDRVVVYNDGSDKSYDKTYRWMKRETPQIEVIDAQTNHGVAYAKNQLFANLMDDCDFIFLLEDDVVPTHKNAIVGYLAAAKMTGLDHFCFAHHGPANTKAVGINGPIVFWPNCVGAYCFYTKQLLEEVGLMDENFKNAWEHVEHSWRIMKKRGLDYGYWPDVLGSEEWLGEIPGSIDNSAIGGQESRERIEVILKGLEYWQSKDKDFPAEHTLDIYRKALHDFNSTT